MNKLAPLALLSALFGGIIGCRPAATPIGVSKDPITTGGPLRDKGSVSTKPVTEMTWTTDEDKVQRVSDSAGKAVVLDFWATYCPPYRAEIPHLNALQAKYGTDKLHIVGLNVGGAEDKPEIPKFLAVTKMDYPLGFPEDDLVDFVFADRDDIPQTAVFDRRGRMIAKIIGFGPDIQKELDAAVDKAVNSEL